MATSATTSGEWLTTALRELRERKEGALHLDTDLIFGLVSFCELAPPLDAADYLAEKSNIKKQQEEAQEAAERQKGKVMVTFDLVGRKVILNIDGATELESEHPILRPSEDKDQSHRIQPNPTIREQPVFVETGPVKPKTGRARQSKRLGKNGLRLEVTGRVQHDDKDLRRIQSGKMKQGDHLANSSFDQPREGDDYECSQDFD